MTGPAVDEPTPRTDDSSGRASCGEPASAAPMWPTGVARRPATQTETLAANRSWWDAEADGYYHEHGGFLGDADFIWGPEGLREADAHLLGPLSSLREATVVEIGAGAGQCARWLHTQGVSRVVATDLSLGMLRQGRGIERRASEGAAAVPLLQCDGVRLPFADGSVDVVFTSYGVVPFVADSAAVMAEAARVLRPGGRFVFSTTHPVRWAFPDVPGEAGLTATMSYFDRTPYVEQGDDGVATYVEHHRTLGDRVRELTAAGLVLIDLIEPEWPESNTSEWGGWSPLRGRVLPGTAIFVTEKR